MDAKVEIVAELGRKLIAGRNLLELSPGDVILLDSDPGDEVTVFVEGIPKFTGKPGVIKGAKAVQITASGFGAGNFAARERLEPDTAV